MEEDRTLGRARGRCVLVTDLNAPSDAVHQLFGVRQIPLQHGETSSSLA